MIHTDEHTGYSALGALDYGHETINHGPESTHGATFQPTALNRCGPCSSAVCMASTTTPAQST